MKLINAFKRMRIARWKHGNLKLQFFGVVQGFAEILDGLVTIFSLGFFCSNFEMSISYYRAYLSIEALKKTQAKQKKAQKETENASN